MLDCQMLLQGSDELDLQGLVLMVTGVVTAIWMVVKHLWYCSSRGRAGQPFPPDRFAKCFLNKTWQGVNYLGLQM
jgi:hypothetical protein